MLCLIYSKKKKSNNLKHGNELDKDIEKIVYEVVTMFLPHNIRLINLYAL